MGILLPMGRNSRTEMKVLKRSNPRTERILEKGNDSRKEIVSRPAEVP